MPSHTTHMTYASGSQMPHRDLRPLPGVERLFERFWLTSPNGSTILESTATTRRDAIAQLYGVQLQDGWVEDESIPLATRVMDGSFDPRNITLEPEYYADVDPVSYTPR